MYSFRMPATVYTISDNIAVNLRELDGTVVIVTVPAAFSGTCTNICVPQIVDATPELKAAGADLIVIVSEDQPHAIKKWVEGANWNTDKLAFASDFGNFELRKVIGQLSEEEGKKDLPPTLGNLMRRSYNVVKDGKIVWQYIEPDSGKYTLDIKKLIEEVKKAASV